MLPGAPHTVQDAVPLPKHPHGFVRVVARRRPRPVRALAPRLRAPELDLHVLVLPPARAQLVLRVRNGPAVELGPRGYAHHLEEGRRQVRVAAGDVGHDAVRHVRPADEERDVDVRLDRALLAGLEPVLADVVAVVRAEDDVRVVEHALRLEHRRQVVDHVVDPGQHLQARAVEGVVGGDHGGVLLGQLPDPARAGGERGVEVWRARYLGVREGGGVFRLRDGRVEDAGPVGDVGFGSIVRAE